MTTGIVMEDLLFCNIFVLMMICGVSSDYENATHPFFLTVPPIKQSFPHPYQISGRSLYDKMIGGLNQFITPEDQLSPTRVEAADFERFLHA